jgi:hypothetical protein
VQFDPGFEPNDEAARPAWWPPPDPPFSPASWALRGEPWESFNDTHDGAVVLYDLERAALSTGGTTRIIARYMAVRFLRIATARPQSLPTLHAERADAGAYTTALHAPPAEARALRAVVQLARFRPPRRIVQFLDEAAAAALGSRDGWGAFALHREAYRLARAAGWHAEAARAAGAIAQLALSGGGRRSPRLWRLRQRLHLRHAGQPTAQPGA